MCNCENALNCDHGKGDAFVMCQRPAGQGRVQWLGFVCDTCFHNYGPQYQCGVWPINKLDPDTRWSAAEPKSPWHHYPGALWTDVRDFKRRRMSGWVKVRSINLDNKVSRHRWVKAIGRGQECLLFPFNKKVV